MKSDLLGNICVCSVIIGVVVAVIGLIGIDGMDEKERKRNIVIFSGISVILIGIICNVYWT